MNTSSPAELFRILQQNCLAGEDSQLQSCLKIISCDYPYQAIQSRAKQLILQARSSTEHSLVDSFLQEYQLDSKEGVVLMGIAEALLRIPDQRTQDVFLQEKLTSANWQQHLLNSDSLLVNLSTSALYVTGKLESPLSSPELETSWYPVYQQLLSRLGAPVIRTAIRQAMQQLAYQFVVAESIDDAIQYSSKHPAYCYSFDMLGEAALTADDAQRYFDAYAHAIEMLARHGQGGDTKDNLYARSNLSIKLSALFARYEPLQQQRAIREISQRVLALARQARAAGVFVTIDAEEAYRLQLSLKIFASVYTNPALAGWHGFGLAVQSYQKSAVSVIDWLAGLSRQYQRTIPLRLVKGAYWDSEIKWAQQQGLVDYPVFTSKLATDVSYLACVRRLFDNGEYFYPQFASHNAHTLSAVMELARQCSDEHEYEFQRLFGMGEPIYNAIVSNSDWEIPCRIYAPVGDYRELLPYLVRRMLENGANSAFVNQFKQTDIALEALIRDPVAECQKQPSVAQRIALPAALYPDRKNSSGVNLGNLHVLQTLERQISELAEQQYNASPLINGQTSAGRRHPVTNPADQRLIVGEAVYADAVQIKQAIDVADSAFQDWRLAVVEQRARCLGNAADLLEEKQLELVSLCMREGGRTVSDALSEVREAVDFCRYYAHSAITRFSIPVDLPGPVGESNRLSYQGRGIFVCISPWNFPIAIFLGQITAALVAGNTVIAKPASATMLTAMRCIQLLHEAGVPQNMLQFVSCSGDQLLQHCLNDPRIAGVAFTGSTDTAQKINQQLARHTKIIPLIAETGGQNVMIADSTALLQQVVVDAIQSAFNSAGQRCSALRVLFIDTQIADQVIEKLVGAMRELIIGDPLQFKTDVGPVINQHAVKTLNQHLQRMQKEAHVWYQCQLAEQLSSGSYFAPCLIELDHMSQLTEEVFGPVLHVIRYSTGSLDQVIRAVNATGYGLTLGIQSRLDKTINTIINKAHVGNVYVNRNMIGAVVGSQPFGGMGLSGTGPKAGGPDYLKRFAIEQTVSINTAAVGGNTELLNNQPLSTIQE